MVKKQSFWGSFMMTILISGLAAGLICLLVPPAWETNDDWIMANMAAGVYGRTESYQAFIHPALGIFLRKLYQLAPRLPWLGILWEATVFASFTAVLWAFRSSLGAKKGAAFWGILVLLFGPCFYSTVNFTRVAAIAAGAGYLLLFNSVKTRRYLGCAVALALNWMGFAVRLESWLVVTVLAGGLGLAELFSGKKGVLFREAAEAVKREKRFVLATAFLFSGCLALYLTGHMYKATNPQILQYEAYNSVRAALLDYPMPEYAYVKEELEELELSAENYSALKDDFITSDPEIFDIATLEKLLELQSEVRLNLWGGVARLAQLLFSNLRFFHLTAVFLLVWVGKGKKNLFLILWLSVGFLLLNYYLVMMGRDPARVLESLCVVTAIYLLWKTEDSWNELTLKSTTALLALALLLNASTYFLTDENQNTRMGQDEQAVLAAMEELNETGRYYLCGKTGLNIQMYDLGIEGIGNLDFGSREHFFYTGGWWINTPSYLNQLTEAGIMNPYRDILRYDNLLLIDQYKTGLVFAYIRSNYDHPWLPENWSVCRKIVDGLYVIGFNKDITADQVSTDIEWVQAAQIAGSEEDLIWFKVLFDGDESLKEKENIYYLQITDSQGETKTYRGEAQQTEAGLQLLVGIDRQEVQGEEVQVAVLRKNLEQRYEETQNVVVTIKNLW